MGPFDDLVPANGPRPATPQRLPAPAPAPTQRPVTRLPAPAVTIDPARQAELGMREQGLGMEAMRVQIAQQGQQNEQIRTEIALREEARAQAEADQAAQRRRQSEMTARDTVQRVLDQLRNVQRDVAGGGFGETGLSGSILRNIPGTAARDLAGSLQSIDANAAFQELARMRQESPTGGALGAVTERELDLLRSTVANLDPNLSQEEFTRQLGIAVSHYERMAQRLGGGTAQPAARTGPESGYRNEVGGAFASDDAGAGARLPEGKQSEYAAFLQSLDPNAPLESNAAEIEGWWVRNGGTLRLTPENAREIAEARAQGQIVSEINYGTVDDARRQQLEAEMRRREGVNAQGSETLSDITGGINEIIQPIISGRTLGLSDEAAGIAGGLAGAFDGRGVIQGYRDERDLARFEAEQRAQRQGGYGMALEALGGFTSGRAPALVGPQRITSAAQLGREGAQAGALAGFGYGEGVNSAPNALLGAATGGALGYGAGRFLNRGGGNPPPPGNPSRAEVAQAASEQGVDILPADVGGATTRNVTAGLAQLPGSAAVVRNAAQRSREQLGNAVERTAGSVGTPTTNDVAGEAVRRAGQAVIDRSRTVGRQLYERAERMAAGIRIAPNSAVQTIDSEIARLSETPEINAPLIAELQRFRQSLTNNRFISVSGLRDARTIAGRAARTEALRATDAQRVMGNVMTSLADDINNGLQQAGRGNAAAAFRRADDLWRQRIEYIDQTLEPIIGRNRSGEQILGAIENLTRDRGNAAQLRRVLRAMDPDELGDLQATLITRIGRARNNQQDAAGEVFSPETFLTRWNEMTPQAKAALFDGELRRNLDQIATIAGGMRESGRFANTSNTGSVVGLLATTPTTLGGVWGVGAGLATQYLTARMMTSPGFTQWLARAPRTGTLPGGYVRRLGQIAAREPAIARELQQFQTALEQAASQSPSRAAAEGQQEQNGRQPPPQ